MYHTLSSLCFRDPAPDWRTTLSDSAAGAECALDSCRVEVDREGLDIDAYGGSLLNKVA